jgi:uncharacterized delta-60 repeat protein
MTRRLTLAAVLAALLAGCSGADGATEGRRTFQPARILVQPDGGILLVGIGQLVGEGFNCGGEHDEITEFMTVRLDSSGEVVSRSSLPQSELDEWCAEEVWDAVVLGDGGVAVGGSIRGPPSETSGDRGFIAVRFAPDGKLAEWVGVNHPTAQLAGWLLRSRPPLEAHPPEVRGLARRADDGVVLGTYDESGFEYALHAFLRNGRPDRRFGRRGTVAVQFAPRNSTTVEFGDIEANGAGIYVFADYAPLNEGANYQYLVFRHRANGRVDLAFGARGKVLLNPRRSRFEVVKEIALQADGRLLAVGHLDAGRVRKVFVTRREVEGGLDSGWGSGGIVLRNLGHLRNDDNLYADGRAAIGVLADGKILVAASIAGRSAKVFRFLKDGRADATFGTRGIVSLPRL